MKLLPDRYKLYVTICPFIEIQYWYWMDQTDRIGKTIPRSFLSRLSTTIMNRIIR